MNALAGCALGLGLACSLIVRSYVVAANHLSEMFSHSLRM